MTHLPPDPLHPAEQSFAVQYTLTWWDILCFYFSHYMRSPLNVGVWLFVLGMFGHVMYGALPPELPWQAKIISFLVIWLGFVAIALALALLGMLIAILSPKNRTVRTGHTLSLGEYGVREETAFHIGLQKWKGVQRLRRTRNYVFIYCAANLAHVVPRRAFSSAEHWEAFYAFCVEHIRLAKNSQVTG